MQSIQKNINQAISILNTISANLGVAKPKRGNTAAHILLEIRNLKNSAVCAKDALTEELPSLGTDLLDYLSNSIDTYTTTTTQAQLTIANNLRHAGHITEKQYALILQEIRDAVVFVRDN